MGLSSFLTQEAEVRTVVTLLQARWDFQPDELVLDQIRGIALNPSKKCYLAYDVAMSTPVEIKSISDVIQAVRNESTMVVDCATLKEIPKDRIIRALHLNNVRSAAHRLAPEIVRLFYASEVGMRKGNKFDVYEVFYDFFHSYPSTPTLSFDEVTRDEIKEFVDELTVFLDDYLLAFRNYLGTLNFSNLDATAYEFDFVKVNETQWIIAPTFQPKDSLSVLTVESDNLPAIQDRIMAIRSWLVDLETKIQNNDKIGFKVVSPPLQNIIQQLITAENLFGEATDAFNSISAFNAKKHLRVFDHFEAGRKNPRNNFMRLDNADEPIDDESSESPAVFQHVVFDPEQGFRPAVPGGLQGTSASLQ